MTYTLIFFAIYIFLIIKLMLKFINDPGRKKRDAIFVLFAPPGCGKTTALAMLVHKFKKKKYRIYANFECKDTIPIKWEDVGKYNFENSVVLIDEAGIDLNNRKYAEMTAEQIAYLKTHRHYRCEMWFASQAVDMDVTVRRLAQRYYVVSRTLFNFVTKKFCLRAIVKRVGIDKNTHQIADIYDWVPLSKYKFKGKKYWKYFDSFSQKNLPDFPRTESPYPLKSPKKKKKEKDPISAPSDPLVDLFDSVPEPPVPKAPEPVEGSASTSSVDEITPDQTAEPPQTTDVTFSLDDLF